MKTYLPHYFKRIGILFVLTAIIFSSLGGTDDFRRGFFAAYEVEELSSEEIINHSELHTKNVVESYFSDEEENTFVWISLFFSITGFFIYLFSKEKIDDEFMQHLRLKSMLQAFIVSWLIYAVVKYIIIIIPMDGIYILQLQLISYVIIFRWNKNKELSEEEIILED